MKFLKAARLPFLSNSASTRSTALRRVLAISTSSPKCTVQSPSTSASLTRRMAQSRLLTYSVWVKLVKKLMEHRNIICYKRIWQILPKSQNNSVVGYRSSRRTRTIWARAECHIKSRNSSLRAWRPARVITLSWRSSKSCRRPSCIVQSSIARLGSKKFSLYRSKQTRDDAIVCLLTTFNYSPNQIIA